jgi:hypothetical protein
LAAAIPGSLITLFIRDNMKFLRLRILRSNNRSAKTP